LEGWLKSRNNREYLGGPEWEKEKEEGENVSRWGGKKGKKGYK